jgi:lipid-A-disaccharide synthase
VIKLADATAAAAAAFKPDAAVLIDSWGFTLRVAQRMAPLLPHTPLIKYVGPQVWAMRAGRAKTLARAVDHLVCIYEFEKPFYAPFNLPVTVSGHPAFGHDQPGDAAGFRARYKIADDKRVLLLLPGSRNSEIARVAPILEDAAAKLCAARPDLVVACVVAPSVSDLVRDRSRGWAFPHVLVDDPREKEDAFAAGTAALAASGTVATEVALQGVPVVVGYRLAALTWSLMKIMFKPRFATLFNIAIDQEAAPEFLQDALTADNLANAVAPLLDNSTARANQVAAQNRGLTAMGRGGRPPAEIAADAVMEVLTKGASAARRGA